MTTLASLIVFDADNTLWDTDAVFLNAQRMLLDRLRSHGLIGARLQITNLREVDQRIAEIHKKHLRYPIELLIRVLIEVEGGVDIEKAVSKVTSGESESGGLDEFVREYYQALRARPALRRGVKSVIQDLVSSGNVLVIATEGSARRANDYVKNYSLQGFRHIEAAHRKSPDVYRKLVNKWGRNCVDHYIVGDQLDKDMMFGKQAGLITIFFPGHSPRWVTDALYQFVDFTIQDATEIRQIVSRKSVAQRQPAGGNKQ